MKEMGIRLSEIGMLRLCCGIAVRDGYYGLDRVRREEGRGIPGETEDLEPGALRVYL
jgi:hypothetical protein